jgi:hypothetical protein
MNLSGMEGFHVESEPEAGHLVVIVGHVSVVKKTPSPKAQLASLEAAVRFTLEIDEADFGQDGTKVTEIGGPGDHFVRLTGPAEIPRDGQIPSLVSVRFGLQVIPTSIQEQNHQAIGEISICLGIRGQVVESGLVRYDERFGVHGNALERFSIDLKTTTHVGRQMGVTFTGVRSPQRVVYSPFPNRFSNSEIKVPCASPESSENVLNTGDLWPNLF